MMNQAMNEEFVEKWKSFFKTPFPIAGNGKQKEAFLKFYKDEQETYLASLNAFQDYVKSNNINGNAGDPGKVWQNYLDSTKTLVSALDSCRQSQREAIFSFLKAVTPEMPTKDVATKKGAERK